MVMKIRMKVKTLIVLIIVFIIGFGFIAPEIFLYGIWALKLARIRKHINSSIQLPLK